jgi:hypothetical protein
VLKLSKEKLGSQLKRIRLHHHSQAEDVPILIHTSTPGSLNVKE